MVTMWLVWLVRRWCGEGLGGRETHRETLETAMFAVYKIENASKTELSFAVTGVRLK